MTCEQTLSARKQLRARNQRAIPDADCWSPAAAAVAIKALTLGGRDVTQVLQFLEVDREPLDQLERLDRMPDDLFFWIFLFTEFRSTSGAGELIHVPSGQTVRAKRERVT